MRILVVEDEAAIAEDIAAALRAAGYVCEWVGDGEEADFRGFTEDYDAVILDLGLPGRDGLSVLREWRRQGRAFPVLILTARGSWQEKVEGMDAGADDYLAKPFEMEELLARLRALIRRSLGMSSATLACGPLVLDTRAARVTLNGRPLRLSPLEYRLLHYLMHRHGAVVSRAELMEHIYDDTVMERNSNTLDVLVGRVRRKIGNALLQTRRGLGYIMECGEDRNAASGDGGEGA